MDKKFYELPALPYGYGELEPIMSEEQLKIHHDKHHKAYVESANALLKKLDYARGEGEEVEAGVIAKKLSFNLGGHELHGLFWENLRKMREDNVPEAGELLTAIEDEFGSFDRFKVELCDAATTVEGSGWVAVAYCTHTNRLLINQIQNHNLNIVPNQKIIFVVDMWEHAYYIDYKNDKKAYAANICKLIDWDRVEDRYLKASSK